MFQTPGQVTGHLLQIATGDGSPLRERRSANASASEITPQAAAAGPTPPLETVESNIQNNILAAL
jgi:hypothetical protein